MALHGRSRSLQGLHMTKLYLPTIRRWGTPRTHCCMCGSVASDNPCTRLRQAPHLVRQDESVEEAAERLELLLVGHVGCKIHAVAFDVCVRKCRVQALHRGFAGEAVGVKRKSHRGSSAPARARRRPLRGRVAQLPPALCCRPATAGRPLRILAHRVRLSTLEAC